MSITRHVLFKSQSFNTTVPKDYFINDCCFGDDVAHWLIEGLQHNGYQALDEPGQEDFGWYLNFTAAQKEYCLIIAYRPGEGNEEGDWICTLERKVGLGFFFGAAKRGVELAAAEAIHSVLSASPHVRDVRWFTDEDFGAERNARSQPAS